MAKLGNFSYCILSIFIILYSYRNRLTGICFNLGNQRTDTPGVNYDSLTNVSTGSGVPWFYFT